MRHGDLRGVSGVVQQMLDCGTGERALQVATDAVLSLLPQADHASIRLCNDELELRASARSGVGVDHEAPAFRKGEGVLGWVAMHGTAARINDSDDDSRFRPTVDRGYNVRSLMSVPLLAERRVLGVLSVSSAQAGAFDEDNEALATLLASFAAQSLRITELQKLAITDAQTLVFNHRYLLPRMEEEMRRAERDGQALSVMLMDLDHFKRVNDDHGHVVGDLVLRMFTDSVRRCVRSIDLVVRRGGEEFVLIMPSTGPNEALHVAERIRTSMDVTPLRPRADITLHQTVSIGVASWNGVESASELDERADHAMYRAKNLGRNRVVLATLSRSQRPGSSAEPLPSSAPPEIAAISSMPTTPTRSA